MILRLWLLLILSNWFVWIPPNRVKKRCFYSITKAAVLPRDCVWCKNTKEVIFSKFHEKFNFSKILIKKLICGHQAHPKVGNFQEKRWCLQNTSKFQHFKFRFSMVLSVIWVHQRLCMTLPSILGPRIIFWYQLYFALKIAFCEALCWGMTKFSQKYEKMIDFFDCDS